MEAAEPVAGALYPVLRSSNGCGKSSISKNVDSLYQLQAKNYRVDSGSKGIEEKTLALVQGLFSDREAHCFSVDEVVSAAGLSKTTARRYLEHGVETGFLEVEMLYGKIGHPRRLYRRAKVKS
ncbi:two-component response regulator for citrate [Klebsiella pneumoniae subsp. rhinoscleromatis]|nr:two-component response regulator for citrate [Klebsiella pneumoniae subsp. rhinoscleromatis]